MREAGAEVIHAQRRLGGDDVFARSRNSLSFSECSS
jgi:hypothetical protein